METIKSHVRPSNASQQAQTSLTGKPSYYRVMVHSRDRIAALSADPANDQDVTFDIKQVFPNQRADLLNGDWEVHLESLFAHINDTYFEYGGIKVCLPDLCRSSQSYRSTGDGFSVDDSIATLPVIHGYASPATTITAAGQAQNEVRVSQQDEDTLAGLPFQFSTKISVHDIGTKVDPQTLFSGNLRIALRFLSNNALITVANGERWNASLLFVHKP